MSTINSSLYRQHNNRGAYKVRPVVIGAPYVLCGFTVGVILMAVGTFITSHAYSEEDRDPVMMGVGPGLLGLGGLLILSSVLICIVACLRNRQLREVFTDDIFTIGASTFYGDHHFIQLEEDPNLEEQYSPGRRRRHSTSGGGTDPSEAVMILANTVADEKQRQRKNSRKLSRNRSYETRTHAYTGPHGLVEQLGREEHNYLGLERIRRAEPLPELAHNFYLEESEDSDYKPRDRSFSMSVRRSVKQLPPAEHRLRRNLTYTQASRARQQQLALSKPRVHGWETQQSEPQRKRSSRRRKPQTTNSEASKGPVIHPLPKYDPDLLRALGLGSDRPHLNRGLSEDGRRAPGVTPTPGWQDDPDVTHGSLDNPRRRPTVVMGVKGFRPKLSGAAYRHSSSIYASDMDLHRSDAMVTSDASQAGNESRDLQSPSVSSQNFPLSGSGMNNRSHESSPTLQSPYDYGNFPTQLDRRRDNSPTPCSTPSVTHSHRRRPLSNISSASESCCSECCQDNHDGAEPEHNSHHNHRKNVITNGDTNPDNDHKQQDNYAK